MIYFETAILAIIILLATISLILSSYKFIQNMKLYFDWKKRQKFAKLFCDYYEIITGEKINITVSLNTDNNKFEYKKEA